MTWQSRYWSKVDKSTNCWLWNSTLDKDGYGVITIEGKKRKAHRLALEIAGTNVQGLVVRHNCDNPRCVNPAHLLTGSQADNVSDMVKRKRSCAKLSEEEVKEIRAKYGTGNYTLEALAYEYKVTFQHISAIFHKIKRKAV